MTSPTNKKTFNLYLNNTVTFILRIAEFATSLSLVVLLHINNVAITTETKLRMKTLVSLLIPQVVFTMSSKLLGRVISSIAINTLTIANTMHSLQRVVQTMSIHNGIVFVSRALLRGIVSISAGSVSMALSPVFAILYYLSDWDGSTLSSMDGLTLAHVDAH